MSETPFIPGARVAVSEKYSDGLTEGLVEKVYKNGNFTIRGSKQQWRPWQNNYGGRNWGAMETGSGWHRRTLKLWDETTDKEIQQKIEEQRTKERWRAIRAKIEGMRYPTPALCDSVEAALSQFSGVRNSEKEI
jgi:hypothetical protein